MYPGTSIPRSSFARRRREGHRETHNTGAYVQRFIVYVGTYVDEAGCPKKETKANDHIERDVSLVCSLRAILFSFSSLYRLASLARPTVSPSYRSFCSTGDFHPMK